MRFIIYNLLLLLLSPLLAVYLLVRLLAGKSREGFAERLGFVPKEKTAGAAPRVWLHAVSVGESVAAKPVWDALRAALPEWALYHSTITGTGQAVAAKTVGDTGTLLYLPFDFLPCVWLALARVRPRVLVIVETELWPNLLAVARMMGIRTVMVNGRISDRSLRGARRAGWLYRWMTGNVDRFCMQSREDAARIISLGAAPDRVTITGNTKFDMALPEVTLGEQVKLRGELGLTRDEPVVVAGSTHPGEEEIVLRAFRQVKSAQPPVRLVIAPRHITRAQEVEDLVVAHGFAAARRSRMATAPTPPDAVIILDTIGELARAYALGAAAFVGGSLVPIGGHNVLEPLALGKPALFGPYMSNFREIGAIVTEAGIGFPITDAATLAAQWSALLANPTLRRDIADRAAAVFAANTGAAQRSVAEIAHLVGVVSPKS
jgi:3-deoxy-D-manno-octulosonic-acid transferase